MYNNYAYNINKYDAVGCCGGRFGYSTRAQPVATEGVSGGAGLVEVALHHLRSPRPQLAHFVRAQLSLTADLHHLATNSRSSTCGEARWSWHDSLTQSPARKRITRTLVSSLTLHSLFGTRMPTQPGLRLLIGSTCNTGLVSVRP